MKARTRRVRGSGGNIRSRPTLRLYRYYSTRAKNLYRQGRVKEARRYWGKAGAVKKKMEATAEKVKQKLKPKIEKIEAKAKKVRRRIEEKKPKLKRFTFSARISYRGKPEKSHDFLAEVEGVAICQRPEDIEALLREGLTEGDYYFLGVGEMEIGIIKEEPTDETIPRLVEWEVVRFRRL